MPFGILWLKYGEDEFTRDECIKILKELKVQSG
jgi:hypothetical protein